MLERLFKKGSINLLQALGITINELFQQLYSIIPLTASLWNPLPGACFPQSYNLDCLKRNIIIFTINNCCSYSPIRVACFIGRTCIKQILLLNKFLNTKDYTLLPFTTKSYLPQRCQRGTLVPYQTIHR